MTVAEIYLAMVATAGLWLGILSAAAGGGRHVGTLVLLLYFVGQVTHTLAKADAIVGPDGKRIAFRAYLAARWRQIVAKKVLGFAIFLLIWDNPALVDLSIVFDNASLRTLAALAIILGYFSDSIADKFLSRWEWLKKDAPAAT